MTHILAHRFRLCADWLVEIWAPAFLFLLIVVTLQHDPRLTSDLSYLLIFAFVVGGVPLGLRRTQKFDRSRFSIIPLVLVGLWIYGVTLGLLNGISPNLVFRNFAAMSLFFVYYVFVLLSPSIKSIQSALYYSAAAMVLAAGYLLLTSHTQGKFEEIGFVALRYHYFLGSVIVSSAMFSLTVRSTVIGPFRLLQFLFGIAIFVAIFLSGSRAFYAALFVSLAIIGSSFLPSQPIRFLKTVGLGVSYLLLSLGLLVMFAGPQFAFITVATSVTSELKTEPGQLGNDLVIESPRLAQFDALGAEITLFGKGLGASLESQLSRDTLGYGFELSYLSLAHKVGILGLLVFLGCAATHMWRSVRTMVRSNHHSSMIAAIAMMGFLFSSWGNPTLFAPLFVCFFCVSLYIERTFAKQYDAPSQEAV